MQADRPGGILPRQPVGPVLSPCPGHGLTTRSDSLRVTGSPIMSGRASVTTTASNPSRRISGDLHHDSGSSSRRAQRDARAGNDRRPGARRRTRAPGRDGSHRPVAGPHPRERRPRPKTLAYPRVYVVERVQGDTVRLFRWAEKGLAAASAVIPLDQAISSSTAASRPIRARHSATSRGPRLGRRPGTTTGPWPMRNEAIRLDPTIARAYVLRGRLPELQARRRRSDGRPQRSRPSRPE